MTSSVTVAFRCNGAVAEWSNAPGLGPGRPHTNGLAGSNPVRPANIEANKRPRLIRY